MSGSEKLLSTQPWCTGYSEKIYLYIHIWGSARQVNRLLPANLLLHISFVMFCGPVYKEGGLP